MIEIDQSKMLQEPIAKKATSAMDLAYIGMTKRELIAGMIMGNMVRVDSAPDLFSSMAKSAVNAADALLEELNK